VDLDPGSVLEGDTPRLIDEWQLAPNIWNVARHEIDSRQARGQFIFSGSATPPPDRARHSGAGRIARLKMRTMSLAEAGLSSGDVSLEALRQGEPKVSGHSQMTYSQLSEQAVKGGWPGLIGSSVAASVAFNRSYVDDVAQASITAPGGPTHDPVRMRRLLTSLARHVAQEPTLKTLASDVSGADGHGMNQETVRTYLNSLSRLFILEELPAWSVALRSRSRLRQRSKMHFTDASLACAALGGTPERIAHDPEYFGHVFESMAIHDLRIYAAAGGDFGNGEVFHYRDNTGLEVDAVVEYSWRDWAALEIKLGYKQIPEAEANLLKLSKERIDTSVVGEPRFLAVITAGEYAYTLPSGVHVIPLAALAA
jgi:predicted AAA+ superfamily ATPase